jgi:type IV pilus assembly protein PilB
MGVPPYLVASSVIGIMAQRLVRTICKKCKKPYVPSELELQEAGITPEEAEKSTFMKGTGCGSCNKSGFRGRMAVFELMMMTSKIREMTFKHASTVEIRKAAKAEGMSTLYMDGIRKVRMGQTTIEEVLRVAREDEN